MNILKIIHIISLLLGLAIVNAHFNKRQFDRKYKNTNPEIVKYDSLIMVKLDSTLTTLQK